VFVGFIPFFSILLPLKVAAVAPDMRIALLGWITLLGAVAASIANIAFGALSDRSHARSGTRRPWIAGGLAGTVISYGLIHLASDAVSLIGAILFFQLALNMLFAPLGAVLADEVPDEAKGLVAAVLGLAHPFSSLAAVAIVTPALPGEAGRYALICLIAAAMILPFLLLGRERGLGDLSPQSEPPPKPPATDLAFAWAARFAVQIAGTAIVTYLFFYFEDIFARGGEAIADPGRLVAWIIAGATIAAVIVAFVSGRLSDRIGRRKPFIALSGAGMAAGLATMAMAAGWWPAALGYGLFAMAYFMFITVHAAFAVQLLPSPRHRGRDLGILNLTNTVPSVIAPLLAMLLLSGPGGYRALLLVLALLAALGTGAAMMVRSRR
jgi:MFS family permease